MKRKTIAIIMAAMLVFGIAVGATIAFLTATSETVTNTFTVGNITIHLQEHNDGTSTGSVVTTRDNIKILPGAEVAKDPFVTVVSGSEKCYVYVTIENELGDNVTLDVGDNWTKIGTAGNKTLYKYTSVVNAASADQVLPVFTKVTVSSSITSETLAGLEGQKIILNAYAHQSDNATEAEATAAAKTWAGIN